MRRTYREREENELKEQKSGELTIGVRREESLFLPLLKCVVLDDLEEEVSW